MTTESPHHAFEEDTAVFPETLRTAVKAATLHGLRVEESPRGYAATIVLDV